MSHPARLTLSGLRTVALAAGVALGAAPLAAAPLLEDAATAAHGLALTDLDRSVAPGDDFFLFANGGWLKTTEIPADRSSYGPGEELTELTVKRTAALIREASRSATAGSDARKIGDYYASFMDAAAIDKRGLEPLQPALRRIDAITDRTALARVLGGTLRADVDVLNYTRLHTDNLLGVWVAQDLDDPARYSPFLLQGGLGMPDRAYYLDPSPQMADIRTRYQAHIAKLLTLVHLPDAPARAARIFELERRMAQVHWDRAASEEVQKGNNHWPRSDFQRLAPGLDWGVFLGAAGLAQQQTFVVWQPSALTGLSALTASAPLEDWKDYLRFHAIEHTSACLPQAFVAAHFAFHDHVLAGTPQLPPRWKRAVAATNAALGEAVGKLYVQRYFPPAEKARVEAMVRNLLAAFVIRIDRLEWMAPETRAQAKAKLAALKVGVGYPDKWRDYSGLEVRRDDAFGNAARAELFDYQRNLAKLGTAVDRGEWAMDPQLVNAVNLPALNALNFPAAYLQPPYLDPRRPASMDYGAIGTTIGHEISHSFDDQGALFDASGRLRNWWTKADYEHFEAAGKRLVAQYDAYRPFPDVAVNGQQTLSENIADVAGLADAYDAWQMTLSGRPAPASGDFNAVQLFFLSYAQKWRQKVREPAARQRLVTDSHAPGHYRALTVRNLDAWYAAFEVIPGQKLFLAPPQRVRVW